MLNGDRIDECESCYYYDSIGELSQRQVMNQEHEYNDDVFLEGLEISFDNNVILLVLHANLNQALYEEREGKIDKIRPNYDGRNFSKLKHLSFTGKSNPTIQKEFSPEFFDMLDRQANYDTMFFSMNTNCSKFVHKP